MARHAKPPPRTKVPERSQPAWMAGFRRLFRYAYQTRLYSIPTVYLLRSISIKGANSEPFGFLVSLRPVIRCAICRNISDVR